MLFTKIIQALALIEKLIHALLQFAPHQTLQKCSLVMLYGHCQNIVNYCFQRNSY